MLCHVAPYWGLRDYGVDGQIGLENSAAGFVEVLVVVFREVRRVLRKDGTCWLNLGDSYAGGGKDSGAKPKDLVGIPWQVALALRSDGWWLRQDIIWHKPSPMPESVTDRCTKSHEYIFMLVKSEKYYFDAAAIAEKASCAGETRPFNDAKKAGRVVSGAEGTGNERPGAPPVIIGETRNKRSVWSVVSEPFQEAHFATFPPSLIEPCIKAGSPTGGTVLDPFAGAGTTGMVADRLGRNAILIELNPEYADMADRRIHADAGMFAETKAQ